MKITPNETLIQKQQLLAIAGIELAFPAFSILGINGEEIHIERFNTGMQDLYAVDYYFQVLEEDVDFYQITARDMFRIQTADRSLLFEVSHVRKDVYSWCRLDALLKEDNPIIPPNPPYNPVNPFWKRLT